MSTAMFSVGLDVHKDSVAIAAFRDRDPEPMRVDRLPYDHKKIRRYFERLSAEGSVRACPGEHRKTDRRDAIKIAQDFRDDRLVLVHVPTEEDERVRDLVRCRET
jgi:transposase